jgi:hypothetical protein
MTEVAQTQAGQAPDTGYTAEEAAHLFEEIESGVDTAPESAAKQPQENESDDIEEGEDDDAVQKDEDEEADSEEQEEVEYDPETEIDLGEEKVKLADLIENYKNKPDVEAVKQSAVQEVKQQYQQYEVALTTNAKTYVENLERGNKIISAVLQVNPLGDPPSINDYMYTGADGNPAVDTQGFLMAQAQWGEKQRSYQEIFKAQQEAHRIAKENEALENKVLREKIRTEVRQLIPDLNDDKVKRMHEVAVNVFGLTDDDLSNIQSAKFINVLWHAVERVENRTKDSGALKVVKKAQPKVVKVPSVAPPQRVGSKTDGKNLRAANERLARTGDKNSAAYLIETLGL